MQYMKEIPHTSTEMFKTT